MGHPTRDGDTAQNTGPLRSESNAWIRLLENATREVFEIMLETHIEASRPPEEPDGEVTAVVGIGGQATAVLMMRVSGATAERIARNLFARDRSKQFLDAPAAVADICNRIAANFKSKLGSVGGRCELSAPVVVSGSGAQCRAMAAGESLHVCMSYQGLPVSVTLDIE